MDEHLLWFIQHVESDPLLLPYERKSWAKWIKKADVRIAELEADMADWREASRKVLDGTCSSDEKHCACVPLLKIELQRLMRLFDDIQDEHLELHQENQRLHNLLIEFGRCQEND